MICSSLNRLPFIARLLFSRRTLPQNCWALGGQAISYNLESGWYADVDPQMTFDWTADAANAWTIPMGADIGKAFNLGSQSLSLQGGAYDLLKRPEGAPQWIFRVSLTFLFPSAH